MKIKPRKKGGWLLDSATRSHNGQLQRVAGYVENGKAYMTASHGGYSELTQHRMANMTGDRFKFASFLLNKAHGMPENINPKVWR